MNVKPVARKIYDYHNTSVYRRLVDARMHQTRSTFTQIVNEVE